MNLCIKISNEEYKNIIEDINNPISYALMKLTPIELECFIMVKCEGLSYSEVANLLGVKEEQYKTLRKSQM